MFKRLKNFGTLPDVVNFFQSVLRLLLYNKCNQQLINFSIEWERLNLFMEVTMKKKLWLTIVLGAAVGLSACGSAGSSDGKNGSVVSQEKNSENQELERGSVSDSAVSSGDSAFGKTASGQAVSGETIKNSTDGGHAIEVDGKTESYEDVKVVKTGNSEGDDADFYGENSAVFATNGAVLNLTNIQVDSDGAHANAVFSYGKKTTVNISNSQINTSNNCSGGLMTTGGGTMNADNLVIYTKGNSSAAIRSDRGGGTVKVTKGSYTTDGTGSPVIYSTADITVSNATLTSTASQGVVVEGKNSVQLKDVTLTADNNKKNSDKSKYYQAVMIYQSMSGDAAQGAATFGMEGGTLINKNGDIFFVNNTVATITLKNAQITNKDSKGIFLRAAAAGWGSEGSNGGNVTVKASKQTIKGDIVVDDVSTLNLYLADSSKFKGAVNSDGKAGSVYVELKGNSTWTLTADSYITSLTCAKKSINLNGHTLYVNGKKYKAGTKSSGKAVEAKSGSSGKADSKTGSKTDSNSSDKKTGERKAGNGRPSGKPGSRPGSQSGNSGDKSGSGNRGNRNHTDGKGHHNGKPSGTPPAKPEGEKDYGNGS